MAGSYVQDSVRFLVDLLVGAKDLESAGEDALLEAQKLLVDQVSDLRCEVFEARDLCR